MKEEEIEKQPNNPLHGVTLEEILTDLVEYVGWEKMNEKIEINCFFSNPSISSSLKFLRKTHWARSKVETMYIYNLKRIQKGKRLDLSDED
jgi:uncharacterized protein (DUF2132 family)